MDGVAYTLSVRSFGGEFDIAFSNPRSGGLSSLADALWSVAGHFERHFPLLHEVISYGHEYKYIKNGRIGSPGVVSPRVPHHPAYGSVQGGSNQRGAFAP